MWILLFAAYGVKSVVYTGNAFDYMQLQIRGWSTGIAKSGYGVDRELDKSHYFVNLII